MVVPIPDKLAERLNALMRPADDVPWSAFAQGLLAAISDESTEEARVAALAYVFATRPFARWSGPPTPASEYPTPPSGHRGQPSEMWMEGAMRPQLLALGGRILADAADVSERARLAWQFLAEQCETPPQRVAVFYCMLQESSPFLERATPPHDVRYNEEMPDEKFRGILWRNRGVIAELLGIRKSDAIETKAAYGDAILAAVAKIADALERAVVFGHVFIESRDGGVGLAVGIPIPRDLAARLALSDTHSELQGLITEMIEAERKGQPCPSCGEVHGRRDNVPDPNLN